MIERLKRSSLNLILPVNCLRCAVESDWVCPSCLQEISLTRPGRCVVCHKAGNNGLCDRCRGRLRVDGVISLFHYRNEVVRELIHQAKYGGHRDALRFLLRSYRQTLMDSLPPGTWQLVPIPLSKNKLNERSFNQAEVIAREIARSQWPIVAALKKTRETASQTELAKNERQKNVRGCFEPSIAKLGDEIIVVDDVITTGSTIREAVRTLKRHHNIRRCLAITLAHG